MVHQGSVCQSESIHGFMDWSPHFQFCPWYHELEFDVFDSFTPGPEYQNVSILMRKAKPSPGIKDCSFRHGLN